MHTSKKTQDFGSIMFADIVGSTHIYSQLGDYKAERLISNCLRKMSNIVINHQGRVIKTIGDEIMCQFPDAQSAALAAITIQQKKSLEYGITLSLRIGLHIGNIVEREGDIYGDVVNIAARMTEIAKSKQIITSDYFIQCLTNASSIKSRLFDKIPIKGIKQHMTIHQILWELDDATDFAILPDSLPLLRQQLTLSLEFNGEKRLYCHNDLKTAINIGRNEGCDIIIKARFVSRVHLQLNFIRGKFVLIDQSTNGTYIKFRQQRELFIRREELPLIDEGYIGLGESYQNNNTNNIYFKLFRT